MTFDVSEQSLGFIQFLIQTERYGEAEQVLRRHLGQDPEDALAMALLAICLSERKQHKEAIESARKAIALEPDSAFQYSTLARCLSHADQHNEALEAIGQAIELDPENETHYAIQASILLGRRRWPEALEAAEKGLAIDPEDETCQNLRAMALRSMGRFDEAAATIQTTLARSPENALSHANQGWTLLHQSRPKEALTHFREALRLDPNLEYARQGIVEALKARNPVYRQLLKYFLWMSRLSTGAQWGVMIGLLVAFRVLRETARSTPSLQPFVIPILAAYGGLVFLTWTAPTLFNLLLRVHPIGKLALSDKEKRASTVAGLSLAAGIASLIAAVPLNSGSLLILGIVLCMLVIPIAGTMAMERKGRRAFFLAYTLVLFMLGVAGAFVDLSVFMGFIVGFVAYTWIANVAISRS
jgi:tetratricopeptide (TPR) repeat protein